MAGRFWLGVSNAVAVGWWLELGAGWESFSSHVVSGHLHVVSLYRLVGALSPHDDLELVEPLMRKLRAPRRCPKRTG